VSNSNIFSFVALFMWTASSWPLGPLLLILPNFSILPEQEWRYYMLVHSILIWTHKTLDGSRVVSLTLSPDGVDSKAVKFFLFNFET